MTAHIDSPPTTPAAQQSHRFAGPETRRRPKPNSTTNNKAERLCWSHLPGEQYLINPTWKKNRIPKRNGPCLLNIGLAAHSIASSMATNKTGLIITPHQKRAVLKSTKTVAGSAPTRSNTSNGRVQ